MVFETLNYTPCENGSLEPGFEEVALYANEEGVPKHAARQLSTGEWASKCGRAEDIIHNDLKALEGSVYGMVVQFLRRPR